MASKDASKPGYKQGSAPQKKGTSRHKEISPKLLLTLPSWSWYSCWLPVPPPLVVVVVVVVVVVAAAVVLVVAYCCLLFVVLCCLLFVVRCCSLFIACCCCCGKKC